MINSKTERPKLVRDMFGNTRVQIEHLVGTNSIASLASAMAVEMVRGLPYADATFVAKNAADTAEALWSEYEKRGWTYDIPVDIEQAQVHENEETVIVGDGVMTDGNGVVLGNVTEVRFAQEIPVVQPASDESTAREALQERNQNG